MTCWPPMIAPISIHALLAESDRNDTSRSAGRCISIHALLAESDLLRPPYFRGRQKISIHALLAESDLFPQRGSADGGHFYPRSPCGERPGWSGSAAAPRYFYPRSPCGERHCASVLYKLNSDFYPRSPCGERPAPALVIYVQGGFLSTLSLRRATITFRQSCGRIPVFLSTLSLRRAT